MQRESKLFAARAEALFLGDAFVADQLTRERATALIRKAVRIHQGVLGCIGRRGGGRAREKPVQPHLLDGMSTFTVGDRRHHALSYSITGKSAVRTRCTDNHGRFPL